MKKALITFAISLTLSLASVLMPFSLYADTLITTSNVLGCNVISVESFGDSGFNNLLECQLDNVYQGKATFTFRFFIAAQSSASTNQSQVYVNGTSFKTYITTNSGSINKTKGVVVSALSNNNLYLVDEPIAQMMWQFPFESYPICLYNLINNSDLYTGINELNGYYFPIFHFDNNTRPIYEPYISPSQVQDVVIMCNKNIYDTTTLQRFIKCTYSSGTSSGNIEFVKRMNRFTLNNATYSVIHFQVHNTGSSNNSYKLVFDQDTIAMPIYSQLSTFEYNSLEFALQFGLDNRLLNNLDNLENIQTQINSKLNTINNNVSIIANGNSQSNSKVNEYNQAEQTMNSTISDYNTIENQFTDDFDQNMQNITPGDHGLNLMGSKFLNSANWVKTQFDRITTGTPFGSVLGFSLVLGLGLLIIGRVFG